MGICGSAFINQVAVLHDNWRMTCIFPGNTLATNALHSTVILKGMHILQERCSVT